MEKETKFVSINQEMQFYCKQYGLLLGIKDLYSIYKRRVWKIKKSYELTPEQIQTQIDTFKCGIRGIEDGELDIKDLLLDIINKIS